MLRVIPSCCPRGKNGSGLGTPAFKSFPSTTAVVNHGPLDTGETPKNPDEFIWQAQFTKFLSLPFGLQSTPSGTHPTYLHPLDADLASRVGQQLAKGRSAVFVAPYATSWTIALVVRALAAGTVTKSRLLVYSSDPLFVSAYRTLTTPSGEAQAHSAPLVVPGAWPPRPGFVHFARSLRDLSLLNPSRPASLDRGRASPLLEAFLREAHGPLLFDGRRIRATASLERVIESWQNLTGPKIFITTANHYPAVLELGRRGFDIVHSRRLESVSEVQPSAELQRYFQRLLNFQVGVRVKPIVVRQEFPSLANLELACRALVDRARRTGPEWSLVIARAEHINHVFQSYFLPTYVNRRESFDVNDLWLGQFTESLRSLLRSYCPPELRTRTEDFLSRAFTVETLLKEHHPPKAEWFAKFARDAPAGVTISVFTRSSFEAGIAKLWNDSEGRAKDIDLAAIRAASASEDSVPHALLLPSPPARLETAAFMSGFAPTLFILVYPWQCGRYNAFLRRAAYYLPRETTPAFMEGEDEDFEEDDTETLYLSPLQVRSSTLVASALRPSNSGGDYVSPFIGWKVRTDRGMLKFSEEALVPTLVGSRFVDIEVAKLKVDDIIVTRSDGAPIDARKQIDALDEIHPAFAEAAQSASLWWGLLKAYAGVASKTSISSDELYESLFPEHEVRAETFERWLRREGGRDTEGHPIKLLGPNSDNIRRLLAKLKLPPEAIEELDNKVRTYRSWRLKAYRHLYRLRVAKLASIWESVDSPAEGSARPEEVVDAELNVTLSLLEDLTAFAKVTDLPQQEGKR
jgi:hypothetical protein